MASTQPSLLLRLTNILFLGNLEGMMGWRRGLGDGVTLLRRVRDAEVRNSGAWVLPGLSGAFILLCLIFYHLVMEQASTPGGAVFRVVVVDLIVFVFALLSGVFTAQKWRANAAQLEELSLSPASPFVVAKVIVAGPLGVWSVVIALVALIEIVMPIRHLTAAGLISNDLSQQGNHVSAVGAFVAVLIVNPLIMLAIAWFHYESVRLALVSFTTHAVPAESLLKVALRNAVVLAVLITAMMGIGFAVTGFIGLFGMILLEALLPAWMDSGRGIDLQWYLAALPGILIVAWFKRVFANIYERSFFSAWLFYQWWGAGETLQPRVYPRSFSALLPYWEAWFRKMELDESNAGDPTTRRREQQRYALLMAEAELRRKERMDQGLPQLQVPATPQLPAPANVAEDAVETTSGKS